MLRRIVLSAACCVSVQFLLVGGAQSVFAQTVYGGISGTVSSVRNSPLHSANVTVISREKGSRFLTKSNAEGHYHVDHLIPDYYDIRVELEHYKTSIIRLVEVYADQDVRADAELYPGSTQENITAKNGGSLLKTQPDVSTLVDQNFMGKLPNFDRNFTLFELLAPGTINLGPVPFRFPDPLPNKDLQGGLHINVNGQHFSGTAFQLDGTDNRDPVLGVILVNPPLDSIPK